MMRSCACDCVLCDVQFGIMSFLMAITSVVAGSAAIWGSVLGCKVTCCCQPTTTVRLSPVILGSGSRKLSIFTDV